MFRSITIASQSVTASGASGPFATAEFDSVGYAVTVSALASEATLATQVETSFDDGATWIGAGDAEAAISSTSTVSYVVNAADVTIGPLCRIAYTLTGASATFLINVALR